MSECVVRMTLPKACVWRDDKGNIKMCPLYWEDEARCQGKDGKEAPWYDGKRPDWCPIICQLKEGHGRLVDADALKDYLVAEAASYDLTQGQMGILSEAIDMIDEQPTIVPAERKDNGKTC